MSEIGFHTPEEKTKGQSIVRIEMEAQNRPDFKPKKQSGFTYISYGEKNDFPSYAYDLFNRCAEHNAIVTGKSDYVFGKGLTYEKTGDPAIDGKIEKFIANANQFETWNDLLPKSTINFEILDGFFFQFIYGKNGKIISTYAIDNSRIRVSECGKQFLYCEDWADPKKVKEATPYPSYNPSIKTGSCIYYCKVHKPSASLFGDTYSIPNYVGALSSIETDINIDLFFNTMSEHGMTAQGMLSLFNGIPLDEEQKKIKRQFEKNYCGPNKAASFLLNFVEPGGQKAELTNFTDSDLDRKFELLEKRTQKKIFVAHKADPVLFGIDTATSWSRPQLLEKWEKFKIAYVQPRQEIILKVIQIVADSQGVNSSALYFEDLPPIGEEIELGESTFNEVLSIEEKRNYLRDKKGVVLSSFDEDASTSRLSLAQKLGVGGSQALQTLMLDPSIQPEQKVQMMVGLYSVPEKKARKMLGIVPPAPVLDADGQPVAMSAIKDEILEAFKGCAIDNNEDEILEVKFLHGNPQEFEKVQFMKFSEVLGGNIKEVRNQIMDLITGDPFTKPETIAKQLGTDVDYVNDQIKFLTEKGFLEVQGNGFNVTEKGLNKAEDLDPVVDTEIYTVYQYALSPNSDYKNSKGYKDTSHEFCVEMMKMANSGKVWERQDIEMISDSFGENAWVYRGGFTMRKTGEVTPYCNHVWKAITKVKKVN